MTKQELTVRSGEVELAVEDYGGDGPPLVLVHGSGANVRAWDLLVPLLTPRFRVVGYDLRSHGRTSLSRDQSMAANVADIDAICARLELERPFVLGHSWGVPIALSYALAHPECPGVIAVDGITGPFLFGGAPSWELLDSSLADEPMPALKAAELEEWFAIDRREELDLGTDLPWSAWAPLLGRTYREEADGLAHSHPSAQDMRDIVMVQMGGVDAIELYHDIRGAILIVGAAGRGDTHEGALGGADGVTRRQTMIGRLRTLRPALEDVWLACGHAVPLEMPQELARLSADFADRAVVAGNP